MFGNNNNNNQGSLFGQSSSLFGNNNNTNNKTSSLFGNNNYGEAIQMFNKCKELKSDENIDECEQKIKECGLMINNGGNKLNFQKEDEEEVEEKE